jgi:histone demethylase JARID1
MFYDNPDVEELREVETDASCRGSKAVPVTIAGQENCEICHKKNRGEEMLLCDGCDCGNALTHP